MTIAVALDGESADAVVEGARALDVRTVFLRSPIVRPRALRYALRANGVGVCGVGCEGLSALEPAAQAAASLRAGAVVVDAGPAAEEPEAAVDGLARGLHGPVRGGVPVAVRNGPLLGREALGWLFEALPRVGFWFDPARVEGALEPWANAYARRATGVLLGRHPDAFGRDLAEAWPLRVPWVLDVADAHEREDGIKALRAMLAA